MKRHESKFYHKGVANQKNSDAQFVINIPDLKKIKGWSALEQADLIKWMGEKSQLLYDIRASLVSLGNKNKKHDINQ